MNIILVAAFAGPIVLVLALIAMNSFFQGMKTNLLGATVTVLGGLQALDWSFLPDEASAALLTGAGLATLMVSQATQRAT